MKHRIGRAALRRQWLRRVKAHDDHRYIQELTPEERAAERLHQMRLRQQQANAEEQMRGFDGMPLPLRRAMQGQIVSQAAGVIGHAYMVACMQIRGLDSYTRAQEPHLPAMFAAVMADWDEVEVAAFSRNTLMRYGYPSPHHAARATILRPEERPCRRRVSAAPSA